MKSTERHKLKENEFARTVAHARDVMQTARPRLRCSLAAIVIVALVLAGGLCVVAPIAQREGQRAPGRGAHRRGSAVIAPTAPAPGSPIPVQQAGTYPDRAGEARGGAAAAVEGGRRVSEHRRGNHGALPRRRRARVARDVSGSRTALPGSRRQGGQPRLWPHGKAGTRRRAGLQGKYDSAIKIYQEAATDTKSQLPLDGVLMQLGRAYMKAGKKNEAAHAFTRVVEEFPQSAYAADARREMEEAKKG